LVKELALAKYINAVTNYGTIQFKYISVSVFSFCLPVVVRQLQQFS